MLALATATTEWISAGASVFAAVGTVGAVIVALWQTRRAETTSIKVSCKQALAPIGPSDRVEPFLQLEAHHRRGAPLTIKMAYLENVRAEAVYVPFLRALMPQLPVALHHGESVAISWDWAVVARANERHGPFRAAYFQDAVGNEYRATFPGVEVRRSLLRRRETYVLPPAAAPR